MKPLAIKPLFPSPVLALAALFCAHSLRADPMAYMAARGGDFGIIDLGTGAFSLLGNSGQTLAGLGVVNGSLYGSSYREGVTTLYTVNSANGSLSPVGSANADCDDFGSTANQLFMVDTSANLYSIDAATGGATLVGSTGLSLAGLWCNLSTGGTNLYFSCGSQLYTLATNTGAATLIGTMGDLQVGALLAQDGVIYAGQDYPVNQMDTLDPVSGVASPGPVLSGESQPFFGLASYPLTAPPADPMAYMTARGGDFGTIDLATGVFSLLGNSGETLAGLAVVNGSLYGSSFHENLTTLYTVNAADGSLSPVGSTTVECDDLGSTVNQLFMVDTDANLYSINGATGEATLIGSTGLTLAAWRGLSTGATDLYFSNGNQLYTLSTNTGAATLIGSMGNLQAGALLMQGGVLYAAQDDPDNQVDILDSVSGVASPGPVLAGESEPFFGLAPYPLPTAPSLAISYSNNAAVVSWTPSITGWTLQTNGNPGGAAWGNYPGPVANNTVTNTPATGNLFFRLVQP
jgi:hypothetical protein